MARSVLTAEEQLDPAAWTFGVAKQAVGVRDRDRSAVSDVPKRAAPDGNWSYHHRLLRSRGKDDSPANLVLLLGSGTTHEHGWMHDHPELATLLGYMLHTGEDPAQVPIWRVNAWGNRWGWHLQTVDGQLVPCGPPESPISSERLQAVGEFQQLRLEQVRAAAARFRF